MKKILLSILLIVLTIIMSACSILPRQDIELVSIKQKFEKNISNYSSNNNYSFTNEDKEFIVSIGGKFNECINDETSNGYDAKFSMLISDENLGCESLTLENFGEYTILFKLATYSINNYKDTVFVNENKDETVKETRIKTYDNIVLLEEILSNFQSSINTCQLIANNSTAHISVNYNIAINKLFGYYNELIKTMINVSSNFNNLYYYQLNGFSVDEQNVNYSDAVQLIELSKNVIASVVYNQFIAKNGFMVPTDSDTLVFTKLISMLKSLNSINLSEKNSTSLLSGTLLTKYNIALQKFQIVSERLVNLEKSVVDYKNTTNESLKSDLNQYIITTNNYNVSLIESIKNLIISL